ncbi:hypothetical protein ABIC83_002525 [Roseateles asaccharophilus]|uniref:hypothetical protein n=1 Tax=Roseateles asaccharophilus TaxID=582607 RepID=UPI003833494B
MSKSTRNSLYVVTYLLDRSMKRPQSPDELCSAFLSARDRSGPGSFPFDGADDPSFFSAQALNGPVTWGVCRADVRNQAQPGDWVAFFCGERVADGPRVAYSFVAAMEIEAKLDGFDPGSKYERYLNRLVRASHTGEFEHWEPALAPTNWHTDWLWRLGKHKYGTKDARELEGEAGSISEARLLNPGYRGSNYIVFNQGNEILLRAPVQVAHWEPLMGATPERWTQDELSQALKQHVLGPGYSGRAPRSLRTTNRQQPHRHVRRFFGADGLSSATNWRAELERILGTNASPSS